MKKAILEIRKEGEVDENFRPGDCKNCPFAVGLRAFDRHAESYYLCSYYFTKENCPVEIR